MSNISSKRNTQLKITKDVKLYVLLSPVSGCAAYNSILAIINSLVSITISLTNNVFKLIIQNNFNSPANEVSEAAINETGLCCRNDKSYYSIKSNYNEINQNLNKRKYVLTTAYMEIYTAVKQIPFGHQN